MASVFTFWRGAVKGDTGMVDLPGFGVAHEAQWVVSAGGSLWDVVEELNPTI